MKPFAPLTLALVAVPAWAHDGVHVHPHGAESWIALALAAVTVGVAAYLWRR